MEGIWKDPMPVEGEGSRLHLNSSFCEDILRVRKRDGGGQQISLTLLPHR